MDIAIISDSAYAAQAAATLKSLFNTNSSVNFDIHLITTGIDSEKENKIRNICKCYNAGFNLYKIDASVLDIYDGIGDWSKFTFMKILIPGILPINVKRCIYIDVDMLITGDITPLWSFKEKAVYGVEDVPCANRCKSKCGLSETSAYINSGVMVMDLCKWRKANEENRFVHFVNTHKQHMRINDQDVINSIFEGNIGLLPWKYNVTNMFFGIHSKVRQYDKKKWLEARKEPIIVHFTNSDKPWKAEVFHPYKGEFMRNMKETFLEEYEGCIKIHNYKKYAVNAIKYYCCRIIDFFRITIQ